MTTKHTPGPLFVVQVNKWPFDIQIQDAHVNVIHQEPRCAYSTKAQSIDDVMNGVGFNAEAKDDAVAGNARQLADARLIAAAPELLEAAISNAEYRAARDSEFGRGYNSAKSGQPRNLQKESSDWYAGYDARAAIAKAVGAQQ